MNSEYRGRFILLDLCHPMNIDTVKTVIESLENALVLCLSFPENGVQFGVSVLNSDFTIIQSRADLRQNYDTISKTLHELLKIAEEDTKVTVQKYKELTSKSLETIFREFLPRLENSKFSKQYDEVSVEIAIVTKKTASVLVEILTDVLKKLQETNSKGVVKKFKIVQLLNEFEEIHKTQQKKDVIECTTCLSQLHYLTCFFKDWLLNPEEYLEILINEHLNLSLKCDVDNCVIKQSSSMFDRQIDTKSSNGIFSLGKSKTKSLEIVGKIPIGGLCPTLVFGIPRRITPTLGKNLTWSEFQINRELFKGLCLELQNAGQGLLTSLRMQTDGHEISTFQFITSDGDILLMYDVAPEELYLPKRMKSLRADNVDEDVTAFVKICLEEIKLLDEYCPRDFPSGMYGYLTNYLAQSSQSKTTAKGFHSNSGRKFLPGEVKERNDQFKKQKFNPGAEGKQSNIHPALLPEDMVQKYRKINSKVFNLPELSQDFSKDLQSWN